MLGPIFVAFCGVLAVNGEDGLDYLLPAAIKRVKASSSHPHYGRGPGALADFDRTTTWHDKSSDTEHTLEFNFDYKYNIKKIETVVPGNSGNYGYRSLVAEYYDTVKGWQPAGWWQTSDCSAGRVLKHTLPLHPVSTRSIRLTLGKRCGGSNYALTDVHFLIVHSENENGEGSAPLGRRAGTVGSTAFGSVWALAAALVVVCAAVAAAQAARGVLAAKGYGALADGAQPAAVDAV